MVKKYVENIPGKKKQGFLIIINSEKYENHQEFFLF